MIEIYTSTLGRLAKYGNEITNFLKVNKIDFEEIDLSTNTDARKTMLNLIPDKFQEECTGKKILPPQVFNDGVYCGDYDQYKESVELGIPMTFLKLPETEKPRSILAHMHDEMVKNAVKEYENSKKTVTDNNKQIDSGSNKEQEPISDKREERSKTQANDDDEGQKGPNNENAPEESIADDT